MVYESHNRLRLARIAAGFSSAAEFARAHRLSEETYRSHEGGRRGLTVAAAKQYGRLLGVSQAWLLTGSGEMKVGKPIGVEPADISGIMVRGFVQAGYWREVAELTQDDWYMVPMPSEDARYPGMELFGLEVRGTSMNKVFPEGAIIACISLVGKSMKIPDGKYVVVQRTTPGGEVEMTVKQFQRDELGRPWLWPRSDDPEHQTPVRADFGDEISIVALVVRSSIPV